MTTALNHITALVSLVLVAAVLAAVTLAVTATVDLGTALDHVGGVTASIRFR